MRGVFVLFLHQLRPEPELVAQRGRAPAPGACQRWRPAAPTCGPSWCRRSSWIGPSTRLGPAPTTPGSCCRSRWRRRTAASWPRPAPRPPTPSRPTPTSWSRCDPQAHGDWAFGEERYNAVLRDAEMLSLRRPRAARARPPADRGADRPAARRRQGDLRLGGLARPAAGAEQGPAGTRRRPCAVGYEDWTERARAVPARQGTGQLPGRRGVRGRAIAALPAPRAGGGLLRRSAQLRRDDARPLLRALPAGRARARRRSPSGWSRTPTRPSRPPPCTRHTPATTGTWSWPRATRRTCGSCSGRATSPRAGPSTRSG